MPETDYAAFLDRKRQLGGSHGFTPSDLPAHLFDFQAALVAWSLQRGRSAIFADCGLGKTPMQLAWADQVVRHTNGRVLILTPLAVGAQTLGEAEKFGVTDVARSRDGSWTSATRIAISNYEQLDKFAPSDFGGIVCDESSILKHFTGATQKAVTRFLSKVPYRLLCTATAAPNDWSELGTSSEAVGELGYVDMLARFFSKVDETFHQKNRQKERLKRDLSYQSDNRIGAWRLKGHAEEPFWRWVASWAKACRKPSDLGFDDGAFQLPPLTERVTVVEAKALPPGQLFARAAIGLAEEREERKRTTVERCDTVARLVDHDRSALVFCQLNYEGDRLTKLIPNAVQVSGSDSDEAKEERFMAFIRGDAQARVLVTKAKIAGFGLNFQHCAHVVTFVSHSYEAYYQSVRRCWRFGQTQPVTVDIVATEGEQRVSENLARKAAQADRMFQRMIQHMHHAETLARVTRTTNVEVPSWLRVS